jgi:hypothetical protein
MAGASLTGFQFYVKQEATPGTELLTGMIQTDGLRNVRLGRGGSPEVFRGGTGKTATGVILADTWGEWSMDLAPCYRTIGLVAASRLGTPVSALASGATTAYEHVFRLNPDDVDTPESYTFVWGGAAARFKATYGMFQSLGFDATRASVSCSTSAISRKPASGAAAPVTPTTMSTKTMQPNQADMWIDATWATLGTTQSLIAYRFNLDMPDKFDLDAPINSSIDSYATLVEKEDQAITLDLSVALDATGLTYITDFDAGDQIAIRYKIVGPEIEVGHTFSIQWDLLAHITSVGTIEPAPNSNVATLPLSCEVASDGDDAIELTLVNDVTSYT